jgi:hypothetical protein
VQWGVVLGGKDTCNAKLAVCVSMGHALLIMPCRRGLMPPSVTVSRLAVVCDVPFRHCMMLCIGFHT